MPIDARIPLGVQSPPPQASPLELYSHILQIQNQRENLASLAAERQANVALAQQRIAEHQRALEGRNALVTAIRDAQSVDPDTGERSTDHGKVINALAVAGYPELSESWSKMTTQNAEALEKLENTRRAHGQGVIDAIGNLIPTIKSRQDFDSALGILASPQYHAITGQDAIRVAKQADDLGPDGWQALLQQYGQLTTEAKKRREEIGKVREVAPGAKVVIPAQPGVPGSQEVVLARGEPKESTVNIGSFEDYVLRWAAQNNRNPKTITTKDIDKLRETYRLDQRPIVVNPQQASNAEAIADAIISGDQPPDLKGMYRYGPEVRAILAKKGYNLTTASIDWQAAQKHFATLNGAQQTRLRQAVDTAIHSLDVIDDLSAKWKGGRFPLLNRANLALAKNGIYGAEVQSVAQQLEAQISDLTSELGNAYMGGNSPTDHALQLAAKNLSADWSQQVLKDMTNLARTNLQIRQNAIQNIGAIGASPQNPYAPPPPPSSDPLTVIAPNGKTYTFKTAAEAAAFKKRAGIP